MSHTKGPWLISGSTVYAINQDDCNRFSARVYEGHDDFDKKISREEVEANALLMSAAPEMLAALEAVLSVADRATVEFDLARTAIAKAKGATK